MLTTLLSISPPRHGNDMPYVPENDSNEEPRDSTVMTSITPIMEFRNKPVSELISKYLSTKATSSQSDYFDLSWSLLPVLEKSRQNRKYGIGDKFFQTKETA